MAKKTLPAQFLPADDDIADVFEIMQETSEGKKTTAQIKFDDLVSDLNDTSDDAELRLYRQTVLGGKASMPFLDSFPVDKFSFSQLQKYIKDTYGGGEYRIHIRANGKLVVNRLMEIEAPTVKDLRQSPIGEAGGILQTVLDRVEKQNQMMMALVQAQQPQQHSRREMLEEMMLFKQLFDRGDTTGAANGLAQIRDTLSVLGDLGIEIGGQKEPAEPGFGDLLEKMSPLLMAGISQPQQPQRKPDPMSSQKMMLKSGIMQLIRAASKNSAREPYAEMLLDQLPEESVREFITDPGAFEKLIKLEPRAAQFKPWFLDLAEHVKAALGMPSQYADLYGEVDDAINAANDLEPAPDDDGTDHI